MNKKCIITAAVTGGDIVPSQSPYLPITPKEIADEAVRSAEAGAAIVHVHARNPKTGQPSSNLRYFEEISGFHKAKKRCRHMHYNGWQSNHEFRGTGSSIAEI